MACVCTYTIDTHKACVSCMQQRGHTNKVISDDGPENNDASSVAILLLSKYLSKHLRIGGRHNGNQRNESRWHMQCVHSAALSYTHTVLHTVQHRHTRILVCTQCSIVIHVYCSTHSAALSYTYTGVHTVRSTWSGLQRHPRAATSVD